MLPETSIEVRAWLERAKEDLRASRVDLAVDPPILGDALFHCQQAVEKALKAFLTAHERPFRKTHELDVLSEAREAVDPCLREVLDPARNLTFYAWAFRYPGGVDLPTPIEATRSLALAHAVCEAILTRLPKEVQP
jgi:HEPN domain-containing protein